MPGPKETSMTAIPHASPIAVSIPARLRPSPLRLIYFDHDDRHARLDAERVLFNFLDFDAF